MDTARATLALGACLVAALAHAQTGSVERRYPLPGGEVLEVRVPAGWQERVTKPDPAGPAAVLYRARSGAAFEVLLTPAVKKAAIATQDELRRTVMAAAEAAKAQAVEEVIPVVELLGPEAQGYYFRATDRAPKRGEYKHLTQGIVGLGEVRLAFSILTNDGQREVIDATFGMLRNARLAGARPAAPAVAAQLPPADAVKLQLLLVAGDFSGLDAELMAYQDAYRRGTLGDEEAERAFNAVIPPDPDLRDAYDKWIAMKPRSYAARLARGLYLTRLGYFARGKEYASKTSQAQFDDMRALFKEALQDLQASLQLDSKPVPSYAAMIDIAQAVGAKADAARYLREALAADARAFGPRFSYLASLRPEWGGSLEEMQAAVDSWKGSLNERQLARLGRMLEDAKWRAALEPAARLVEAKRFKEAIAEYDRALAQAPVARAFAMRGYSYAALGEHARAIQDFDRALELDPHGVCCSVTRSNRARSYLAIAERDKGIADLVAAAESYDTWAARELAAIYAFGRHGFKRDYTLARRWCELSAKQGDGLAMYCIGSIYHAGLGVPKDLARAARWFEGAAARGIADAQADYAFMLWNGQGIPQDRDQAIKWWRAAARQGNKRAAAQLENLPWWDRWTKVALPDWLGR